MQNKTPDPHRTLEGLLPQLNLDVDTTAVLRAIASDGDELPTQEVPLIHCLLRRLGPGRSGWESPRVQKARRSLTAWLDGSSDTGPAVGPAILREQRPIGLVFAGQGAPWFDELAELVASSAAAAHTVALCVRSLQSTFESLTAAEQAFFPYGVDVAGWLRNPESRPPQHALLSAVVAFPMVFALQAAHLSYLLEQGMDRPAFRDLVCVAAGHSSGLVTATWAAETWRSEDPARRAADYVRFQVFVALRASELPIVAASPVTVARCAEQGLDAPSGMAAVTGMDKATLQAAIDALGLPLYAGVQNTRLRHVVSGAPDHLDTLRIALGTRFDDMTKAHKLGKHFGHLPILGWEYLIMKRPFHSPLLTASVSQVRADVADFEIIADDLAFPVLSTATALPLAGTDLVDQLIMLEYQQPVDFVAMSHGMYAHGARCLLDFGPLDGTGKMAASNLKGRDLAIAAPGVESQRLALLDPTTGPTPRHAPFHTHVPGRTVDGALVNRFTRWTSMPPVFLPGMTPTTADAPIVAAAANAGFMAELAGGGQVTESIFRARLDELVDALEPGRGIVFNALYLDPYLWRLHFGGDAPLVVRLRDEGYPIIGVTVTAGIPPLEEAVELLETLNAHGIWLNSLKPGTHAQIKSVLKIADATPNTTIMVQIEGGKAGGHHSWEDLGDLLDTHYGALRSRDNLVLAAGGGITDEAHGASLLDGSWTGPDSAPMPVDAIFLGTACMAALEAATSPAVKAAMVAAPGTDATVLDGGTAGGVTSGKSGLNAPIHYLDNTAASVGRLLDSLAGDADAVAARHDEIVAALAQTAKPWFGDVAAMTWTQVLTRYADLSAVGRHGTYEDGAWPDRSYRARFLEFLRRGEARLTQVPTRSIAATDADADDPIALLARFETLYGAADRYPIGAEDARFFVEVCRRPGKPVCFVPVIDADVRRWFKSDSLWQSHHDGYAADSVLVIPGPRAVSAIRVADQPIASILAAYDQSARASARLGPVVDTETLAPRIAVDPKTGRVWTAPSERTIVSAGKTLDLCLVEHDGVLHWPREDYLDAQAAFYDSILGHSHVVDPAAFRRATEDDSQGRPLTSAFASCWRAIFDALVEDDGVDLLSLLHESNDTEALGAWPVADDATLSVEARRTQVTRSPAGRRIVVEALLKANGADAARVVGTFFVRGEQSAVASWERGPRTFELALNDEVEAAFLTDQPWVTMDRELSGPVGPVTLNMTHWLAVDGNFEAAGQIIDAQGVAGRIDATCRGTAEHPVAAVAGLLALAPDQVALELPRELGSKRITAPLDMQHYAAASGDLNPIHVDPALARYAGLDGVVVHGMWTASAAIHRVARLAAGGSHNRIRRADVRFVDVVWPGERLVVEAKQVAMRAGRRVIDVSVRTEEAGRLVVTGQVEVAQPTTAWVFPGQGIQKPGMGMAVRARSRAARAIWDRAEVVCREELGFSLLHVVQENPTRMRVGDETLVHPDGMLYLTQFTQAAMVVTACAQVAELRELGAWSDEGGMLAGHSVGEYAALCAVTEVLPLENVVPTVYERGRTMHQFVERDEHGRSPWAMGVMRPHVCGLTEPQALAIVDEVRSETGAFVEVVNFNVRGRQYSVTGAKSALARLEERLNSLSTDRPGWVTVPGIDVPFHSRALRDGVPHFRATMERVFPERMPWRTLVGRYVPNLVAEPFQMTVEFAQTVLDECGSDRIAALIAAWDDTPEDVAARTLLIELLAWQFASPVRWIETQDLFIGAVDRVVEVGVAHQPTVANMMRSTLRALPHDFGVPHVLNVEADLAAVLGPVAPVEVDEAPVGASPTQAISVEAAPAATAAVPVQPPPVLVAAPGDGSALEDVPVSAAGAVQTVVALQGRLRLDQIDSDETLDEVLGGNSSRRNQVMADLSAELGSAGMDGAHEVPLGKVGAAADGRGGYTGHGGYLAAAIDAVLQREVAPAKLNRDALAEYLDASWGLGNGHVFAVTNRVALSARNGRSSRGGDLSTLLPSGVTDAKSGLVWVDSVVAEYGRELGRTIAKPGQGGGTAAGGGLVDPEALSEATAGIEARLAAVATALKGDSEGTVLAAPSPDAAALRLAAYDSEHDEDYLRLVTGCFDANKHVALISSWAWIKRDQAEWKLGGASAEAPLARNGSKHAGKTFVVTGAGPGSIALAMVRDLLSEGARVVVTTSRYRAERVATYASLYREVASRGAELHVLPCNQGSFQDVDAFVSWLLERWQPDVLVPFGAIGESADLSGMGPRSLATLRILMLGVERMIARIADGLGEVPGTRVTALLPLSPNHGIFGGDGAYAESKAGLEALLNKWHVERWGQAVTLIGAKIGWVRGTGLMAHNDDVASELEGVGTWDQAEMAAALLESLDREPGEPSVVDLTRGLADCGPALAAQVAGIRERALARRTAEAKRDVLDAALLERTEAAKAEPVTVSSAPSPRIEAPIPTDEELSSWRELDHLDLSQMVAIVGYGEVGPWGSSRSRWAAEKSLDLGLEAIAELAWTMGLVKPAPEGSGWIDVASGKPVADHDLGERYETHVLEHSGIRVADTQILEFDPHVAMQWTDVHLDADFEFDVPGRAEAEAFRSADPEHTEVVEAQDGSLKVRRLAGTSFKVRRALRLDRSAGGQVPSGWDPARYGLPPEIIEQVDRTTLFLLIATAEAFLQAGMEPEEMYAFIHPARVATTQSSGIGGMGKMRRLNQDFEVARERQSDVLQETLINVIGGWVVQSYLGCYGDMRLPVGACATAAVSVASGLDLITAGRADLVVTGGVDDWTKEGAVGFMDVGATASTDAMAAKGIGPRSVCRPNDRRRGGFVESHGAGVAILCRASVALDAGLPVYGMVAYAGSFGDGINRSVPAPGIGLAACLAEQRDTPWDPAGACDFEARRAQVLAVAAKRNALTEAVGSDEAERIIVSSRRNHGHDFWLNSVDTAPLRGALAVFGLGADDVAVASKHDTSTAANDPNEAQLHEEIQQTLGRSADTAPVVVISQKSLTGHSKGGAAAWQINGVLQVMSEGVIPGNRHLEDVDDYGKDLEHICFTERPITTARGNVKAALVTSLGFGHIAGLVALVHPFAFWRTLGAEQRETYRTRCEARTNVATRRLRAVLAGRRPLVTLRTERPFPGAVGSEQQHRHEVAMLKDSTARRPLGTNDWTSNPEAGSTPDGP